MSLLSYERLVELVETGVITANRGNINASSIDITLDEVILVERPILADDEPRLVNLWKRECLHLEKEQIQHGYVLRPGEFILASSRETFNLPNHISAEYKLKSSMARNGLEHLNAGWCDAGWTGSKLTLELVNITRWHSLYIPGNENRSGGVL